MDEIIDDVNWEFAVKGVDQTSGGETLSRRGCGNEGTVKDIGAGKTLSVVESQLSESKSESSCTNPDGGCDGDQWGLGTFNEVSSDGMGWT